MKNIVFDLGGVVFQRRKTECPTELIQFFSFIRGGDKMPEFWTEYDRGTYTFDEVTDLLTEFRQCPRELTERMMRLAIDMQRPVIETEHLIRDLKKAGYHLYVLSNMSLEFIEFLRKIPVYSLFDGEVVSCNEHVIKPEDGIYEILIKRFNLTPYETLFIDDRSENVEAAEKFGINGCVFNAHDPKQTCDALRQRLL